MATSIATYSELARAGYGAGAVGSVVLGCLCVAWIVLSISQYYRLQNGEGGLSQPDASDPVATQQFNAAKKAHEAYLKHPTASFFCMVNWVVASAVIGASAFYAGPLLGRVALGGAGTAPITMPLLVAGGTFIVAMLVSVTCTQIVQS